MLTPDPAALLRTLNRHCTRALEAAAGLCMSRGHHEVTVEHLLAQLLSDPNADAHLVLLHYGVDKGRVEAALQRELERQRSGNTGRPVFSPLLLTWLRDAWLLGSTEHKATATRSGMLLAALLLGPHNYTTASYVDHLSEVPADELRRKLLEVTAGSIEEGSAPQRDSGGAPAAAAEGPHGHGSETALGRFTIDFTAQARASALDPVIGRESEIRQAIDVLARRRKNNPIIVGEAGVGKTALVEGIAQRIVSGDVPDKLQDVELLGLDLGLLQAGAGVKGEFENRLKSVIEEVQASAKPIILFIDEAHTLIGAGGPAGGGDAANLLKPALARGELRTVAATTWSEYKKYFEKDAALSRRFQLVKVDEPSEENAVAMMRGLAPHYESGHSVRIRDEAVVAAVELSSRYISGRQLPDKAVDLLDTCAARVSIGQNSKPPQLADLEREIEILERERGAVERDLAHGAEYEGDPLADIDARLAEARDKCTDLERRWQTQQELVAQANKLRAKLVGGGQAAAEDVAESAPEAGGEAGDTSVAAGGVEAQGVEVGGGGQAPAERDDQTVQVPLQDERSAEDLKKELEAASTRLRALHEEELLVPLDVTSDLVASVVSDWTGVPVGRMIRDEAEVLLELDERLKQRIRGQDFALGRIAETVRGAKLGLARPETPIGVFLLVGPSGVGKTETALSLADLLFGGERFLVTVNMSEFQEKHTVSRLIGSPPGYVGYGEGGVLTEAVRQRPYSAVVLDEVEKADPEVLNLFYQVFDKGQLSDGEGRDVDFRNTVILLTSNLASNIITEMCMKAPLPTRQQVLDAIKPVLSNHFKPALLARMTVVPYFPLSAKAMRSIVDLKLGQLRTRLEQTHRVEVSIADAVAEQILQRCAEVESGARNIDHIMSRTLLPLISRALLSQMSEGEIPPALELAVDDEGEYELRFSG